jgi:Glycosyltransferase family 87
VSNGRPDDSSVTAGGRPPASLLRVALPLVAVAVLALVGGAVVWSGVAAGNFGYDFLAYHQAANRVLAGERLYDPSVQETGGFGLYYYPPPFVLAILPLAPLAGDAAAWIWLGLSVAALVGGIWLMPVAATVRWVVLLLAGLSWPVAYAFKLGQVGPLLLLLFAIGWRWLDKPVALGGAAAAGAIVKIQPGIVLAWALLTRRWATVAVGIAVLVVAALVATVVTGGIGVWADYVALLRNVSDPITTPHNFTPGALLYQSLPVPTGVATAVQVASSVAAAGVVVLAAFRATAAASYLAAVVASQLLSPVLWDHYAMLLLLPTAWLLDRGHAWAVAIPLATSVLVLFVLPPAAYPVSFWAALVAVAWVGISDRRAGEASAAIPAGAG